MQSGLKYLLSAEVNHRCYSYLYIIIRNVEIHLDSLLVLRALRLIGLLKKIHLLCSLVFLYIYNLLSFFLICLWQYFYFNDVCVSDPVTGDCETILLLLCLLLKFLSKTK